MKKLQYSFWFLVLPIFFFTFNHPALSQPTSQSFLVKPWAVGQSATYQIKTFRNNNVVNIETTTYSIVGTEMVEDKNYFWVEIEQDKNNGVTVTQKLQMRQPGPIDFQDNLVTDFHFWTPRRRIQEIDLPGSFKRSTVNEFELSPDMVKRAEVNPFSWGVKDHEEQFSVTHDESVQVTAGVFKANQFRKEFSRTNSFGKSEGKNGETSISVWGSPEIPILGLVKKTIYSKNVDGTDSSQETELVSHKDSGAYSKIKGNVPIVTLKQQEKMKEMMLKNQATSN